MTNSGRNDPCPCGSGKKFKRCCGDINTQTRPNHAGLVQQEVASHADEAQRLYQLGNALVARGQIDQAIDQFERAVSLQPDYAEAHNNLGNARALRGQIDRAVVHYERAPANRPDYADAHYNLGLVRALQGNTDRAAEHYERALALRPNYAEAHCNLGHARMRQSRIDEAIAHYERAISRRPDYAEAHCNLGNARVLRGETNRAVVHYERALALRSDYAEAHNGLGNSRAMLSQTDRAVVHYERAVALRPDYAEAHCNLGNAFRAQGQRDRAVVHYERALTLRPDYAEAHNNLGLTLATQGQIDQAILHYELALSVRPDYAEAYSNLLFTMNYASDKDPAAVYAAHLDFARRWETPLIKSIQSPDKHRQNGQRLRLGYVSSDFRQHSISYFIGPVLAHHDRERFEIFCYSNHATEDSVTERLKSQADHWRSLVGCSDERAVQQIRADQIDILVDLNGHTGNNRLLVFARKPALIQVTWIGYPNTTGLSAMDYRITDGFADPPGTTEHLHSEKLVRLPKCFSCYQPPRDAPEVSPLPALEKGHVTFGCFNNMAKMTSEVMAVWAVILHAIPGSRLTLKNPALNEDPTRQRVQQTFAELGITPERLELLGRDQSQTAHLGRYRNIDIGLDPFPYNGTTTTCEALWMGVPVVALAGKTHAGRVGVSLMNNLRLTELVSHTVEEYISIAQRLAANLEHLDSLRAELRSRLANSPLTNGQEFTKHLEQAYLSMWQNWCRQASPQQASLPNQ